MLRFGSQHRSSAARADLRRYGRSRWADTLRGWAADLAVAQLSRLVARPIGTTFADLLGKLTVLRVECSKCGRFGRYPLHRLIDQHGGNGTILEWLAEL